MREVFGRDEGVEMLSYSVYGPTGAGRYLVIYPTPGCAVPTTACNCSTQDQADAEAARLNQEQEEREFALQAERELCGLHRIQNDLDR